MHLLSRAMVQRTACSNTSLFRPISVTGMHVLYLEQYLLSFYKGVLFSCIAVVEIL